MAVRKAIDPSYRKDILELAAGFERERRSLSNIEPTLWGIRAPSKERVRMMLQSLQRELNMTMDQGQGWPGSLLKLGSLKLTFHCKSKKGAHFFRLDIMSYL